MRKVVLLNRIMMLFIISLIILTGCQKTDIKTTKEISIHLVFNNRVFDEEWDIYKFAAEENHIVLKSASSKNYNEADKAFNLLLSSRNLPDIIAHRVADLERLGVDGIVLDMSELIKNHAPNIKKFMNDNPHLAKDLYASDGKIYTLPSFYDYDNFRGSTGLFIRTDWLKKFNLSVPTTVKELEHALVTFRENDANGNGRKDEVGLFARGDAIDITGYATGILGAYRYDSFYLDENGEIQFAAFDPAFKKAMVTLADWYKKGLVDKELFTRGWSARDQVIPADIGAVTMDWIGSTSDYNYSITDIEGFEFLPIPPLRDKKGAVLSKNIARNTHNNKGWSITSGASDPVTIIKFMDWWFSKAGRRAWNFGIEGKHYTLVAGVPQFTEYVLNNPDGKKPLEVLYLAGAQIASIGVHQDVEYEKAWQSEIAKEGHRLYKTEGFMIEPLPILKIEPSEVVRINKIISTVERISDYYIQKWITGTRSINEEWDNYMADIKHAGIFDAVLAYQRAYDKSIAPTK